MEIISWEMHMTGDDSIRTYYEQRARERLAPADFERHRRAVARIQATLFDKRRPEDYFIRTDSLALLPPIASTHVDRGASLGGVTYEVEGLRPKERIELKISHWAETRFTVFVMVYQDSHYPYTRFAAEAEFRDLADVVFKCIHEYRREQGPGEPRPGPTGRSGPEARHIPHSDQHFALAAGVRNNE